MNRFLLLIITVLILAACGSPYKDLLKEGNEAFDEGEFDQAKKLYEFALDEDPDGEEAKEKIALIESYEELNDIKDNADKWAAAFDLANKILKNDSINEKMKKETKEILDDLEDKIEREKTSITALEDIQKQIKNKDFDKASKALDSFKNETESSKVYTLKDEIYIELDEAIYAQQEDDREKEAKAEEKKREEEAKQAAASVSKYDQYSVKAETIEENMMDVAYEAGYMHDYAMVSDEFVDEWDDLLNEVWKELKTDLDNNTFKTLQEDQREWIKEKEASYNNNSNKKEAETDLGFTTMNRTNYLIENYLN